jgi:hypothetical protein
MVEVYKTDWKVEYFNKRPHKFFAHPVVLIYTLPPSHMYCYVETLW